MSVELSKQKLDIDEAARSIKKTISELEDDYKILIAGIKSIDNEGENILESRSILAQEVRGIMRKLIINQ